MAWVALNRLLLLERSDRAGAGGVRQIPIDLTNATNILGRFDDEFGIDPANPFGPTRVWKLRLVAQLPVAK